MANKIDTKKFAVLFILALLFLAVTNVFIPLWKRNARLNTEEKGLRKKVQLLRNALEDNTRLNDVRERASKLEDFLKERIPSRESLPELTELLGKGAAECGVVINSIHTDNPQTVKAYSDALKADFSYDAFEIILSLRSSILGLAKYLAWLRQQPRLISIKKIELSSQLEENEPMVSSLTLQGYALDPEKMRAAVIPEDFMPDVPEILGMVSLPKLEKNELKKILAIQDIVIESRQDPLSAANEPKEDNLVLSGIVLSRNGKASVAVINGQLVKEGQSIGNYRLEKIEEDKVILKKGAAQVRLVLKKKQEITIEAQRTTPQPVRTIH